jgi:Fe2+ transport system protein FeoA
MLLSELKIGESGLISRINADKALKDCFSSLGIFAGEMVHIRALSLAKRSIEVEINHSLLALRATEAEKIEIVKQSIIVEKKQPPHQKHHSV